MADFAIPNLCGANPDFNKLASQFDSIKDILANNLEADAAALASSLGAPLDKLEAALRAMIPQLPSISAINFQAEVTSLAGLVPGSSAYLSKLALIKAQFGSVLPDIDSLITSALDSVLSGGSLCSILPNYELPSGATDAVQKAQNSLQANVAATKEKAQEFSTDDSVNVITGIVGDAFASEKMAEVVDELEKAVDQAKIALNSRAERLEEELKKVQIQKRKDEVIWINV